MVRSLTCVNVLHYLTVGAMKERDRPAVEGVIDQSLNSELLSPAVVQDMRYVETGLM